MVVLQAVRFGVTLYCARALGPEDWGVWVLLNTALAYSYLADLGVVNAMNREIPFERGRNDPARLVEIERTAQSVALVSAGALGLAAGCGALLTAGPMRRTLLEFAFLVAAYKLFTFSQCHWMAHRDFRRLSRSNLALSLLTPSCALPLAAAAGLHGFLYSQILIFAAGALALGGPVAKGFRWRCRGLEVRRLSRMGLPIAAVGVAASVSASVDRWVVGATLGAGAVGLYSLAALTWSAVNLVPQALAAQFYPRLSETWGRTLDPRALEPLVRMQNRLGFGLTLPVVMAIEILLPPLVRAFLPAYAGGIHAMRIAAAAYLVQPLWLAYGSLYNTLGRQRTYLAAQLAALAGAAALSALAVRLGGGLEGVALASGGANAVCALALAARARRTLRCEGAGRIVAATS